MRHSSPHNRGTLKWNDIVQELKYLNYRDDPQVKSIYKIIQKRRDEAILAVEENIKKEARMDARIILQQEAESVQSSFRKRVNQQVSASLHNENHYEESKELRSRAQKDACFKNIMMYCNSI